MSQSRGLESSTARRACQGRDMALRRMSTCEFQLKESANPGRPPRVSLHIRMLLAQQIGAKIC